MPAPIRSGIHVAFYNIDWNKNCFIHMESELLCKTKLSRQAKHVSCAFARVLDFSLVSLGCLRSIRSAALFSNVLLRSHASRIRCLLHASVVCSSIARERHCPASINWHEIPLASYWHELQLWSHSPMEPAMRWPSQSKAACNVLGADAGSWQIDEQCSSCSRINKELQFRNGQQCFPPRWSKLQQQQQHSSTSSNVFANSSNVLSTGKHFVVLHAVVA